MGISDDEGGAGKTYTFDEVMAIRAKDKATSDRDAEERMKAYVESHFKECFDKMMAFGSPSVPPLENPVLSEEEVDPTALAPKASVAKAASSPSFRNVHYDYPPQNVPMPHMNPSGNPPKLDECNYSF